MTHARFAKLGLAGLLGLALVGGAAVQAAETKPPVSAGKRWESEFSLWQKVSASSDPTGYQDYLQQYPNGTFASMARLRLAELNAAGVERPSPEQTGATDSGEKDAAEKEKAAAEKEKAAAEREKAKAAEAQRLKAEQEAKIAAEKAQAEEQRRAEEAERKREAEAVEAERRKAEQQEKAEEAHRKAEEQAKAAAEAKAKADEAAAARAKAEAEQAAAEADRKRAEAAAEAGRLKAEQEARAAAEAKAKADAAAADRARAEAALAEAEAERARAEEAAAAARLKAEEVARDNAEAKGTVAAPGQPGTPDSADTFDTEALPTEPETSPGTDAAKSAETRDKSAAQSGSTGAAGASGAETTPPGSDAATAKATDAEAERLARREDNSWSRAILSGKRDEFESYLGEFPNGRFAAEARERLAAMDKEAGEGGAAAAEAETKAGAAKPADAGAGKASDAEDAERLARREDNSWSRTVLSGSRDAYESYLDEFPNGRFAAEARQRLAAIEKEGGGGAAAEAEADTGNVLTREPAVTQPLQPRTAAQAPKVYQTPPDVREAWLDPGTRAQSQRYLDALGYGTGGADGVFGPRTRAAIASWQRSLGLRADGYLTRKQYLQLRESAQFAENRNRQRATRQRYQGDPYGDGYYLEGPVGGYYDGPADGYLEGPVGRGDLYLSVPGY